MSGAATFLVDKNVMVVLRAHDSLSYDCALGAIKRHTSAESMPAAQVYLIHGCEQDDIIDFTRHITVDRPVLDVVGMRQGHFPVLKAIPRPRNQEFVTHHRGAIDKIFHVAINADYTTSKSSARAFSRKRWNRTQSGRKSALLPSEDVRLT